MNTEEVDMLSAIDYGKEFLTQYFNKRDIDAAAALLADDVIWITPDEIRHLRSRKSIRDFIVSAIEEDPDSCSVDVAATLSVPNLGEAYIAVYDVNIIPKGKENAANLRCTFGMRRLSDRFEIAYIGMSRKFHRTDAEQIRSFADALPCGVMTLTCVRRQVQPMYASAFFCEKLGYEEGIFYDKLYTNPYFMLSVEEQRRMQTLVAEMSSLRSPKPLAMRVNLIHSDGETTIPCYMTIAAAYKTGDQTVLYLVFDEISDLLTQMERQKRKEQRIWMEQQDKRRQAQTEAAASGRKASAQGGEVSLQDDAEQQILEIRRDAERQIAAAEIEANVRVDEALRLAHEEADAAEKLIRAQLEKAAKEKQALIEKAGQEKEQAVAEARRQVESRYSQALQQEKERQEEENRAIREEAAQTTTAALEEAEQARRTAEEHAAENAALKEQVQKLEESRRLLEQQMHEDASAARQEREALRAQLVQEKEQALREAAAQSDSAISDLRSQMEQEKAAAAAKQSELSGLITRQQKTLKEQESVIRRGETDRRLLSKEKDKSLQRLETLLAGELRSMSSAAAAAGASENADPEELKRQLAKLSAAADGIPLLAQDLDAIASLDVSKRQVVQEPFAVSSCLDLARRVIKPQCRAKGIIFSAGAASGMPDAVIGSKAGLELAFLCVLENAVEGTLSGGHITMSARSDKPVRGSAYYHFTVKDSGAGIPEERLRILFDDPESELAIARQVIAAMGGSIQVRSKEGEGTTFEIRVNLKLQK